MSKLIVYLTTCLTVGMNVIFSETITGIQLTKGADAPSEVIIHHTILVHWSANVRSIFVIVSHSVTTNLVGILELYSTVVPLLTFKGVIVLVIY